MKDYRGKTALVTGAGRRLGRDIALSLAERGMDVIVHFSTSEREAGETAELARKKGVRAWAIRMDFTGGGGIAGFTGKCTKAAGSVDVRVNSASIYTEGDILTAPDSQFIDHLNINALAPLARLCGVDDVRGNVRAVYQAHVGHVLRAHIQVAGHCPHAG